MGDIFKLAAQILGIGLQAIEAHEHIDQRLILHQPFQAGDPLLQLT